jgi:NAD(P)-dependent dehydrogenase (short-subunit alcohol dehydrogenase family)
VKDFAGKVVVITGGASGLGREFANMACARGMKIVLADVEGNTLERAATELRAQGAEVLSMLCDVRKGPQVQALADKAVKRFGAVHLVFNNAGVGSGGLIWENSEADWEWVLGVNLWGVIHGVRIFASLMLELAQNDPQFEGHIVNTASMAGLLNAPTLGVYNVSKHAVVALSETLYHDLQLVGAPIGASVLCPYFVPTAISQSHRNRPADVKMEARPTISQLAAQAMTEKAVESGKVSAAQVAQMTFDAIADGQFYIYSHPDALASVAERMDDIVHHRNPGDPYGAMPQVRERLRSKLSREQGANQDANGQSGVNRV